MSDTNPFGVRLGVLSDRDALVGLLLPYYDEAALQPASPLKVALIVDRCLRRDGAIAGVVTGEARKIIATIGLAIETEDYTDHPHLRAKWLFVAPEHRREPRVMPLLHFAKWAQEQLQAAAGVALPLVADIMTRKGLEQKIRSYQRALPMAGAFFSWGIEDPAGIGDLPQAIQPNEKTHIREARRRRSRRHSAHEAAHERAVACR